MVMDAKDIQSDLHSLKRLYGLLKNDRGDMCGDTASDLLDEHARLLLKNLLDAAAKRALKAHSEIIAGQVEASGTISPTQVRKLSVTAEAGQSCAKEMDSDNTVANGPEYKTKRCRVCQRNTVKQLESVGDISFNDVAQGSLRVGDLQQHHQNTESNLYSAKYQQEFDLLSSSNTDESKNEKGRHKGPSVGDECTSSDIEPTTKPREVDCLSKEASEAIKRIDFCVSAIQIGADHLHLFEETKCGAVPRAEMSKSEERFTDRNKFLFELEEDPVGYPLHSVTAKQTNQPYMFIGERSKVLQPKAILTQSACHFIRKDGMTSESDTLNELESSAKRHKLTTQKTSNLHARTVGPFIGKIESGNWETVASQIHKVQNFSVGPNMNVASNRTPRGWHAIIYPATKTETPYQSHAPLVESNSRHRIFQPSDSFLYSEYSRQADSWDNAVSASMAHAKRYGDQSVACHRDGIPKNRQRTAAPRTSIQLQDSDNISSGSYTSNWASQETGSHDGDSAEYSYVTPSTGSESRTSLLSPGTGSQYSSYTSNGDNEVYSSTDSYAVHELTSRSSSRSEEEYSSYDQPRKSISRQSGPRRIHKSADEKNHNKQSGTWKRLKDKLAIIFHHHHHHHHHHHANHGDTGIDQKEMKSLSKYKGKSKSDEEAYGERAVEKARKSQQGHFHGLMEGFLRHVRHSKKSKPRKEAISHLAKGQQQSRKKTVKKSQWWQSLKQHKGAKLPNKTHLKLGLGNKRTRLKALPKLK